MSRRELRVQLKQVHNIVSTRSTLVVVIVALLAYLCVERVRNSSAFQPAQAPTRGARGTYTTNFPSAESPISEAHNWVTGRAAGLDWADVLTTVGLAFGTEAGDVLYDDSTALLVGNWGPDQMAEALVRTVNQTDTFSEEVELRLRSSLSPHSATGYEVNFRCSKTANAYAEIVRWNGPLGSFTYLKRMRGSKLGVKDGDVVKATIIRNVITAYINNVQVIQTRDATYQAGSPGMGFYNNGNAAANSDFGFASFRASDQWAASPAD
jgi:hypothetical protein